MIHNIKAEDTSVNAENGDLAIEDQSRRAMTQAEFLVLDRQVVLENIRRRKLANISKDIGANLRFASSIRPHPYLCNLYQQDSGFPTALALQTHLATGTVPHLISYTSQLS
jgi:hypothetical protein